MQVQNIQPGHCSLLIPRHFFGISIIALFLIVPYCSTENSENQSVLTLSGADSGDTVKVAVGWSIEIKLQTIGPGEYETPEISTSSVQFLSSDIVMPAIPAGPTQLYRFRAVTPGTATVAIPHSVQAESYTITINVTGG